MRELLSVSVTRLGKIRRSLLILTTTILLILSFFIYFLQNATKSYANNSSWNPDDLAAMLAGSSRNYFYIPSVSTFLDQLQKNSKIARVLKSAAAKEILNNPPFAGIGPLSYWFEQLPDLMTSGLVASLFGGSFYYSYNHRGYLLAIDLTKAGELAARKMTTKLNLLALPYEVYQGRLFVASSEEIFQQYKRGIDKLRPQASGTVFKKENAYLKIDSNEGSYSGKDVLMSLMKTVLKPQIIRSNQLEISVSPKGLTATMNSPFRDPEKNEEVANFKKMARQLYATADESLHTKFIPADGLLMQWHMDPQFFVYTAGKKAETDRNQAGLILLNGFAADHGLILAETSFYFNRKFDAAYKFLYSAFNLQNAKIDQSDRGKKILFKRYSYYDESNYYNFMPTMLEIDNKSVIWSSTSKAHLRMLQLLERKSTEDVAFQSFLARYPQLNSTTSGLKFFTLKTSLHHLLKNSAEQLKEVSGAYYVHAFDDLKSVLMPLANEMKTSMVWGRSQIQENGLLTVVELEL